MWVCLKSAHCGHDAPSAQMNSVNARVAQRTTRGGVVLEAVGTKKSLRITMSGRCAALLACGALFVAPAPVIAQANAGPFTMEQVLAYPFVPELDAAEKADAIAFVRVLKGVRNVWVAD